MSVFRVHHQRDYTVISNRVIRDKELSLKTLGLFTKMLSLPPDWDFSIKGLASICKEGEYSVATSLQELEDLGYLKRTKLYQDGKVVDIQYDIYECGKCDDVDCDDSENLNVENLKPENLLLGFSGQLNKDDNKVKKETSKEENKNCSESETLSHEEFFAKYLNKKDFKTLSKWVNMKISDRAIADAMIQWLKLMFANNKFQTLETLNSKIDSLYNNKGDLDALAIIEDTIEKGYFSFSYSITALKNKKSVDKAPTFQYNKNTLPAKEVKQKVELDSEVF